MKDPLLPRNVGSLAERGPAIYCLEGRAFSPHWSPETLLIADP